MKFRIPLSVIIIFLPVLVMAAGWKMHPSFWGVVDHVIETPSFVYFTSQTLPDNNFFPARHSLFRFDKEGEELIALSSDNLLTTTTISGLSYSPDKRCLLAVGSNYDIILISEDGRREIIPDYRLSNPGVRKNVRSVTWSVPDSRFYISTEFGFLTVSPGSGSIEESRIYGTPFTSAVRIGTRILAISDGRLVSASVDGGYRSITDFEETGGIVSPYALYSLDEGKAIVLSGEGEPHSAWLVDIMGGGMDVTKLYSGYICNVSPNRNGIVLGSINEIVQIDSDGNVSRVSHSSDRRGIPSASWNLTEIWEADQYRGLSGSRCRDGKEEEVTHDFMLPNSPVPFISTAMESHPEYGVIVQNFGFDRNFADFTGIQPLTLSSYRDGEWIDHSVSRLNPEQREFFKRPGGIAVDPDNPDYLYVSSVQNALARVNLKNPADVIHMSKESDNANMLPGFVAIVPDQTGDNSWCSRFSSPRFDTKGNLWSSYTDLDHQDPPRLHLLCWEAADRRATTSAADIRKPKFIEIEGVTPTNTDMILPLKYTGGGNLLLYTTGNADNRYVLIDTKDTPANASDDRVVIITTLTDQDGNVLESPNVRDMWEDPATGNVWVGYHDGVYYFNPTDFLEGNGTVRRIKVAREDGTNLADYLLNLVTVNMIDGDAQGRKWMATNGAGLVCLSSDNRRVEMELNSENSGLPGDRVFAVKYLEDSNSLLISTEEGISEYQLPMSHGRSGTTAVKAYPNPVRPDYVGYVTIEGLEAGSLVKIADAAGNVVKQLREDGGGAVRWDVTGISGTRVASGVYYVLASGGMDSDFSEVTKILVVN